MMVWMGMYTQTFHAAIITDSTREDPRTEQDQYAAAGVVTSCRAAGRNGWRTSCPLTSCRRLTICCAFLPEMILTVAGTLLMVLDPLFAKTMPRLFGHLSIAGTAGRGIGGAISPTSVPGPAFGDLLVVDGFATFFRVLVMAVGMLAVLSSYRFLDRRERRDRRVSRAAAVLDCGTVRDGFGQRPDHDFHRPRDFVDCELMCWPAICATTSGTMKPR